MGKIEFGFYRLDVWKLGMDLVKRVYDITKAFPQDERYSLTSQLRRAVVSVPLNIAEGSAKRTKADFAKFVRIALGSLMEVVTCLHIAVDQKYLTEGDRDKILKSIEELYFKLIGLDKVLVKNS